MSESTPTSLIVVTRGLNAHERSIHFDQRALVMDVLLGETIGVPSAIATLETISKPEGATVTRSDDGRTLSLSAVGRYHLKARTAADVEVELRFLVIEQAACDWLAEWPNTPGCTSADPRAGLRYLANHEPQFDGTRESLHV